MLWFKNPKLIGHCSLLPLFTKPLLLLIYVFLILLCYWSISIPLENIKKWEVFWCFQGYRKSPVNELRYINITLNPIRALLNPLISSQIFGTTLECLRKIYIDPSYKTTDLVPETSNFIKKVFSCEFSEIFKNTLLTEQLWAPAYD